MEKGPKIEKFNETLFKEVEQKVEEAIRNAPDLELIQLQSIKNKNTDRIGAQLEKATIVVKTLFEFGLAMEMLGLSEGEIQDTLAHENAHANKAESLGAKHEGYKITLVRNESSILIQPHARIYIPDEWSDDKIKDTLRKVVLAPEEYGNNLSPDDIDKLKTL